MMRIALVLFNGVTFLDFAGFYDVIYRLNQLDSSQGTTWDMTIPIRPLASLKWGLGHESCQ